MILQLALPIRDENVENKTFKFCACVFEGVRYIKDHDTRETIQFINKFFNLK